MDNLVLRDESGIDRIDIDGGTGLLLGDVEKLQTQLADPCTAGRIINLPAGAIFYLVHNLEVSGGRLLRGGNQYVDDDEDGFWDERGKRVDGTPYYAEPGTETVFDAARFCPPNDRVVPVVTGIDGGIEGVTLRHGEIRFGPHIEGGCGFTFTFPFPGAPPLDFVYPVALLAVGYEARQAAFEVRSCVLEAARRGVLVEAQSVVGPSIQAVVEGNVLVNNDGNGVEVYYAPDARIDASFRDNRFWGVGPGSLWCTPMCPLCTPACVPYPVPFFAPGPVFFVTPVNSTHTVERVVTENNIFEDGLGVQVLGGIPIPNLFTGSPAVPTTDNWIRLTSTDDQFLRNTLRYDNPAAVTVVGGWSDVSEALRNHARVSLTRPTFDDNNLDGVRADIVVVGGVEIPGGDTRANMADVVVKDAWVTDRRPNTFRLIESDDPSNRGRLRVRPQP